MAFRRRGDGGVVGVAVRGQDQERLAVQRVSREDGVRLPENDVIGRLAAAHVVIVHAGQVVVDQGISVHQLRGQG